MIQIIPGFESLPDAAVFFRPPTRNKLAICRRWNGSPTINLSSLKRLKSETYAQVSYTRASQSCSWIVQWRIQPGTGEGAWLLRWRPGNFFASILILLLRECIRWAAGILKWLFVEGFYFLTGLCLLPFAVSVLCIACRLQQQVL